MDKIEGYLEVGWKDGEVVVNHPDLKPDENGVGHIVFSPAQARSLATLLIKHASIAEDWTREQQEAERLKNIPPVDRSKRCMTDGSPVTEDHREIDPNTGQQKGYVALCPAERAKGFVRPVRRSYRHMTCNSVTSMGLALAETYARDPGFYSGTFCCQCQKHFPLDQFVWEGTTEKVGS
jgi:hypothetical protein